MQTILTYLDWDLVVNPTSNESSETMPCEANNNTMYVQYYRVINM